MYLIEAEANCHLTPSKEAEARQLLKELIRDSGRDPQYTCDKSGQALLDEIKFYRRIELWGEGLLQTAQRHHRTPHLRRRRKLHDQRSRNYQPGRRQQLDVGDSRQRIRI